MKPNWTAKSLDDLENIYDFIAQDNPDAAARTLATIFAFVDRQLEEFPKSGRPGRVAGTLELVIPRLPYVVPYRIKGDRIEVLRVYHGARMWPEKF